MIPGISQLYTSKRDLEMENQKLYSTIRILEEELKENKEKQKEMKELYSDLQSNLSNKQINNR